MFIKEKEGSFGPVKSHTPSWTRWHRGSGDASARLSTKLVRTEISQQLLAVKSAADSHGFQAT